MDMSSSVNTHQTKQPESFTVGVTPEDVSAEETLKTLKDKSHQISAGSEKHHVEQNNVFRTSRRRALWQCLSLVFAFYTKLI